MAHLDRTRHKQAWVSLPISTCSPTPSNPPCSVPIVDVEEACKHEVQFGNLCADCGKDMTTVTYNTATRDTARATVNAVHGHTSLLVSRAEASKSDEEAKRRLLSSRKLSLVVDLDQTIIQATVDPTVAEWQRDPQNPNYPAVKDVRAFQLVDDGPGARACWYYIKLRPGLEEFLSTISKYYELHIYTMGTRTYAQNIAKIVDPDRKIFADRILSRDESGSLTVKNLKRLFPVDTKMVVIIDDRGDVWHWCHNLVKVTPYDFFVGIGDINSSFLPKRPGLDPTPSKPATLALSPPAPEAQSSPPTESSGNKVSAIDQLVSMGGGNDPTKLKEQTSEQGDAITAQLTDRPLLQKQKILDAADEDTNGATEPSPDNDATSVPEAPIDTHNKYRHNLLQDNDTELRYLQRSLQSVHSAFFEEYDRRTSGPKDGRVAELRTGRDVNITSDKLDSLPDVTSIMAAMKLKVLKGVNVVFSGVMPLGVQVQK
jgi:RNA polymerase II subunit A-like phosphatase